jgi:hypothetical protein
MFIYAIARLHFRMHRGFSKPNGPSRRSRQRQAGAAAGVAIAAAIAAAVLLTLALGRGPGRHDTAALSGEPVPSADTGAGTEAGAGLGSPAVSRSARPARTARASPAANAPPAAPAVPPTVSGPAGGTASAPRPSVTRAASEPSSHTPSARSATATATVKVTVTATPRPVEGTLSVGSTTITLSPLPGSSASFTLTALNGPVTWSVTLSQGLAGDLSVSPSSGTLAEGASTTVTATVGTLLTAGGQLTADPGGIAVTVALGSYFGL